MKFSEQKNNIYFFQKIKNTFKLKKIPKTIEIYDISHISGEFAVGVMVSFNKDGFIKNNYRKFNIKGKFKRKEIISKSDDYSMIYEVLNRRLKESSKTISFPDLIIIDGGKGHLSTALNVLENLNLEKKIELISIAKSEKRNEGNETFYIQKNKKIKFKTNDKTLFFLQRLRDEAHRFAISFHRDKRIKGIKKSSLDQIGGIGKIRKKALLNHFGSARAVEVAALDELRSVDGIEQSIAKKIHNFFHN